MALQPYCVCEAVVVYDFAFDTWTEYDEAELLCHFFCCEEKDISPFFTQPSRARNRGLIVGRHVRNILEGVYTREHFYDTLFEDGYIESWTQQACTASFNRPTSMLTLSCEVEIGQEETHIYLRAMSGEVLSTITMTWPLKHRSRTRCRRRYKKKRARRGECVPLNMVDRDTLLQKCNIRFNPIRTTLVSGDTIIDRSFVLDVKSGLWTKKPDAAWSRSKRD